MILDHMPIWVVLLATIGLVVLALEAGVRLGRRRKLRAEGKSEVSGAMVGATMALLAFMLAFTFNGAAGATMPGRAWSSRKRMRLTRPGCAPASWLNRIAPTSAVSCGTMWTCA